MPEQDARRDPSGPAARAGADGTAPRTDPRTAAERAAEAEAGGAGAVERREPGRYARAARAGGGPGGVPPGREGTHGGGGPPVAFTGAPVTARAPGTRPDQNCGTQGVEDIP